MSAVASLSLSKKAVQASKKERITVSNAPIILLLALIVLTLAFQVIITVRTEALRQKTDIILSETARLRNKNLELMSQLSFKFTPQAVEKYAREHLKMEFAIIAPETSVVYLNERDIQALAALENPAKNASPLP